jgi:hypothetical protein
MVVDDCSTGSASSGQTVGPGQCLNGPVQIWTYILLQPSNLVILSMLNY